MSSVQSARRPRDHCNGVASAVQKTSPSLGKSTKTLTSLSLSTQIPNPKSNLRAAQRPASLCPIPAVDKAAIVGPVSAGRRSISSVPRGRSSSPSEFVRVFRESSAKKGERGSRNRVGSSAGNNSGIRNFSECKENVGFGVVLVKQIAPFGGKCLEVEEKERNLSGEDGLSINLEMPSEVNDAGKLNSGSKVCNGSSLKSNSLRKSDEGSLCKDKRLSGEGVVSRSGVKYQNKLHEKLAFLEGRVKRIASDIKKTKEMLDVNNPEASKVMLLDIQDKISGIEKSIGHGSAGSVKSGKDDGGEKMVTAKSASRTVDVVKGSIKELNSDELEARLFPHHKLLRSRTMSKMLSGSCLGNNGRGAVEGSKSCDLKGENELLSHNEENLIAEEFLDSINGEEAKDTLKNTKATLRPVKLGLDTCDVQESNDATDTEKHESSNPSNEETVEDILLTTDETLDDIDCQENSQMNTTIEEPEDTVVYQLNEIGTKNSTAGWFVSEGESVLLAHDDGSCTFYDIANCEEKVVFKPPVGISPNIWADCWIVRAPGADGCSGKFVVTASAGNSLCSGFCSWDFYNKDVRAFHSEDGDLTSATRTVLGPLPSNTTYWRNAFSSVVSTESQRWWYRPCGALIVSSSSSQRMVKVFDIRDGEQIMEWQVQKPVATMDYSSPLQWRNRGKVVVAEAETISVWDVNSLNPQPLLSISSSGQKISALHIVNTDAELGGGVRQRVTSAEAQGNEGVFCTADSINILDFRHPSGIGIKIPKISNTMQSVYTRGDSVYVGSSKICSTGKNLQSSQVLQFSLRKQKLVCTYSLPESNAHFHHSAITQVWGNSNMVMATSGMGLFVFDALKEEVVQAFGADNGTPQEVREVVGPNDLYSPSFDYLASRVLLISKDRPALWKIVS